MRPPDALRRRMHLSVLSGRLNSHRLTRGRQHCLVVSGGQCELDIRHSGLVFFRSEDVLVLNNNPAS